MYVYCYYCYYYYVEIYSDCVLLWPGSGVRDRIHPVASLDWPHLRISSAGSGSCPRHQRLLLFDVWWQRQLGSNCRSSSERRMAWLSYFEHYPDMLKFLCYMMLTVVIYYSLLMLDCMDIFHRVFLTFFSVTTPILMRMILYISNDHFVFQFSDTVGWAMYSL